jgi:hypothetical protein
MNPKKQFSSVRNGAVGAAQCAPAVPMGDFKSEVQRVK